MDGRPYYVVWLNQIPRGNEGDFSARNSPLVGRVTLSKSLAPVERIRSLRGTAQQRRDGYFYFVNAIALYRFHRYLQWIAVFAVLWLWRVVVFE